MLEVGLFVALSALIVVVSRKSLLRPGSHGFYRFFAWEVTAAIICLNIDRWFRNPFGTFQVVSWLFLASSIGVLVLGVIALKSVGKPKPAVDDPLRIGIEKTTVLVTVGIYRYIRHPLYSSVLFLAWGATLKEVTWISLSLAATATAFTAVTAKVEEIEDIRFFGQSYKEYMKKSRMFIPFLF